VHLLIYVVSLCFVLFCIPNATSVSLNNSVNFLVSFLLYVKVASFVFQCCKQYLYFVFVRLDIL
jgi:hypothetical protein